MNIGTIVKIAKVARAIPTPWGPITGIGEAAVGVAIIILSAAGLKLASNPESSIKAKVDFSGEFGTKKAEDGEEYPKV